MNLAKYTEIVMIYTVIWRVRSLYGAYCLLLHEMSIKTCFSDDIDDDNKLVHRQRVHANVRVERWNSRVYLEPCSECQSVECNERKKRVGSSSEWQKSYRLTEAIARKTHDERRRRATKSEISAAQRSTPNSPSLFLPPALTLPLFSLSMNWQQPVITIWRHQKAAINDVSQWWTLTHQQIFQRLSLTRITQRLGGIGLCLSSAGKEIWW